LKYKRKTKDVWDFYVNYGQGWEYEIQEQTPEGMKENRKQYKANCKFPFKIIKRREKI